MSDLKISALPTATPLGTDKFPVALVAGTNAYHTLYDCGMMIGAEPTITAHAGGGQASSVPLTSTTRIHVVSVCATAGDSISFDASAAAGVMHYIRNNGVAACQLYGVIGGTDTINGVAGATGISIPANSGIFVACAVATKWTTTPPISDAAATSIASFVFTNVGYLNAAQIWSAAQRSTVSVLTDGATVTPDLSLSNNYFLAIAGNRTLGVPTNIVVGQQGIFNIRQDTTGSRTLAYAWVYRWVGGTAGTLSTPGCSEDQLVYSVDVYSTSVVTMTIAAPGVITWTGHGLTTGQQVQITTTGALPTGLTASTTYFWTKIDANSGKLSTTLANCAAGTFITTTGSQSGVHTAIGCSIKLALNKAYV